MGEIPNLPAVRTEQWYPSHPIAGLLPEMEAAQLAVLVESIKRDGLVDDIALFENKVLDGRGRQEACRIARRPPRYRQFFGSAQEAQVFVITQNVVRRHLSDEQRAMIAARLVNTVLGSNQHSRDRSEAMSAGRASALLNAKLRTVSRYLGIAKKFPEVAEAVVSGRITFSTAKKIAELPEADRALVLSLDCGQQQLDAHAMRRLKLYRLSKPVTTPEGLFDVIVADFPWPIKPEPAYSTMTLDEIRNYTAEVIPAKAADHCFLFLWATEATREFAVQMLKDLGWTIRELFVWHKSNGRCHPGRPFQNSEFAILAERGKPEFIDTVGLRTCFFGNVGGHSTKPAFFFEMIKRATTGRRLEMFARKPHEGFEPHGNEIDWSETARARTRELPTALPVNPIRFPNFQKWLEQAVLP